MGLFSRRKKQTKQSATPNLCPPAKKQTDLSDQQAEKLARALAQYIKSDKR